MRGLGLAPAPLGAGLAWRAGTWRDGAARIATVAYRGAGVRWMRVARVTAPGVSIANLLLVGEPERALPILGVDLVTLAAREGSTLVAADLTPVLPDGARRDAQLAEVGRHVARWHRLPSAGALPGWATTWFSPHAIFTRAAPGALDDAGAAVLALVDACVALAMSPAAPLSSADVGGARAAQLAYAAAHRDDDRGLALVGRMFGAEWGARYLREVLFPE